MDDDEKNILRKALIEIDYEVRHLIHAKENIHKIKKKLLKDLKMPEAGK